MTNGKDSASLKSMRQWAEEFDLRVESRFKNGLLFRALDQLLGPGWTQAQAARYCGVSAMDFGKLIRLKLLPKAQITPRHKEQGFRWRRCVLCIAGKLAYSPEQLFPETLYSLELPDVVVREYRSPEVLSLQEAAKLGLPDPSQDQDELQSRAELRRAVDFVLKTLSPREEAVLQKRFGITSCAESLSEIATDLRVSRERVRQIEAKALRKLRHPSKVKVPRLLRRPGREEALANRALLPESGWEPSPEFVRIHRWMAYLGTKLVGAFTSPALALSSAVSTQLVASSKEPIYIWDRERRVILTAAEMGKL